MDLHEGVQTSKPDDVDSVLDLCSCHGRCRSEQRFYQNQLCFDALPLRGYQSACGAAQYKVPRRLHIHRSEPVPKSTALFSRIPKTLILCEHKKWNPSRVRCLAGLATAHRLPPTRRETAAWMPSKAVPFLLSFSAMHFRDICVGSRITYCFESSVHFKCRFS